MPSPNPEVARALVGNQATGSLTAWEPSLRDRIAYLLSDAAGYLGAGRYAQQDIAQKTRDVIDFIPGVGEAVGLDDAWNDLQSGNYGMAATGLGLTALGVVPGVGDAAASALRNFPYHRFTKGDHPDTGVGYMMFAQGDPDRVRHYGDSHWVIDPDDMPQGAVVDASDADFQQQFADMLRDNWDDVELRGYGHVSPEELAADLAPSNIVDTAGFFDSDLVDLAWERFFEPRGILGVRTPDGFVSFDPQFVRRVED